MKVSEALNVMIELGRKIRAYYDVEVRKRHKHYPFMSPGEEEAPPPPEEQELAKFLATLSEDVVFRLLLIMYIGREGFPSNGLQAYLEEIKEIVGDDARDAADEIAGDAVVLEDELSDALDELGKHKIDIDKLPLKRTGVKKGR